MVQVIGIGYQGRSDEEVIESLRQAGVRIVVDVRANPYSRGKKSLLNRNRVENALMGHGIRYIWHGDLLGNPVDATGRRTLEGFRQYMKTLRYEQGLLRLCDVLHGTDAVVALLCLEREDKDCHRHLIIEDIRSRQNTR